MAGVCLELRQCLSENKGRLPTRATKVVFSQLIVSFTSGFHHHADQLCSDTMMASHYVFTCYCHTRRWYSVRMCPIHQSVVMNIHQLSLDPLSPSRKVRGGLLDTTSYLSFMVQHSRNCLYSHSSYAGQTNGSNVVFLPMSSITGLNKAQILTYLTAAHVSIIIEITSKLSQNVIRRAQRILTIYSHMKLDRNL